MKYLHYLPRILVYSFLCGCFIVLAIFIFIGMYSYPYIIRDEKTTAIPQADAAIVLGASVKSDGTLSSILQDRADTAIALYTHGYVKVILVTGDNGSLYHNEVNPTRDYLIAQGIPSGVIFLDHAGFDTYSSMYRAHDVFLVHSAVIATQSFHLPRAVFLARSLGINAYGVPADQHVYSINNNLREVLADVKAVLDVIQHRKPEYLGNEIPISGDSGDSI